MCLRETAVQSVSARNSCTICVYEKHLYNAYIVQLYVVICCTIIFFFL